MHNIVFIAPSNGTPHIESNSLGMALWLWLHSNRHSTRQVSELSGLLLPAITQGQFLMAVENGKPVGYMSWAFFSEEIERKFLQDPEYTFADLDWCSGDRPWIIDLIVPFGHLVKFKQIAMRELLPACVFRKLSRTTEKGKTGYVTSMRSYKVSREQARAFNLSHPVAVFNG